MAAEPPLHPPGELLDQAQIDLMLIEHRQRLIGVLGGHQPNVQVMSLALIRELLEEASADARAGAVRNAHDMNDRLSRVEVEQARANGEHQDDAKSGGVENLALEPLHRGGRRRRGDVF